ncbi:hypothetical protein QCA50_009424 [Cerrena zonata]|uniref:Uncharacterized protein n=1 Tax=Cerrena zonata TaxID=2478898 RepID=A0AAW0G215_9APHY
MESLLTCINALQINSSKTTQSITELNETLIKYTQVTLTQVEETQNAMKILKSIDNHLREKELRAIYNDAAAKFKGRIKQDQGIESFLHFWKDLKFLLFFHNKHHLVDYLSEKESDELTEAEKVLLEQIILSAVDDRLEMKLRLDCRLQRDKKEDDYALKLFRIVRRKAIGAKSWEGYFYHYVPSIVPTHGEDASDTYICRINEVKQLQKWNNNHGERLVACLLYESQPSDFRHYFENYWEKLHPVKGFRTEEELAHDIREDLETL